VKTKLLGSEGMIDQMRVQIEVMGAQPERRTQNDLVEHRRQCIDDQICAARGTHDGPNVAGVRLDDFNPALSG